jgi:hypothetical protein
MPIQRATCFFPVEYLTVTAELQLPRVLLVPVADDRVPRGNSWFVVSEHAGSVACVEARGTNFQRMAERASVVAINALRGARVALGGQVHASQLRFRLGIGYAFDDQLAGWKRRADAPSGLTLADVSSALRVHPALSASTGQRNDVEKKAALAMTWLERAWETGDDLLALLFRFFALEALLGDKSAGLKAHTLAFREMTLSHAVTGGFRHPNQTFLLYDQVRSGAVHGEHPLELDSRTYSQFEWSVRDALDNYLAFARDRGIARRGRLLRDLDTHPDRPQQIEWLRDNGGPRWTRYLDSLT